MFNEKYQDADLRYVDPSTVDSVEECDWLMRELDNNIADMEENIARAKASAHQADNWSDPDWFFTTNRTIKESKACRQTIQNRRGVLSREQKTKHMEKRERAFVDAAMRVMTREDVRRVWDEVKREHPELAP